MESIRSVIGGQGARRKNGYGHSPPTRGAGFGEIAARPEPSATVPFNGASAVLKKAGG